MKRCRGVLTDDLIKNVMKRLFLSYLLMAVSCLPSLSQELADSTALRFKQGQWKYDSSFGGNGSRMEEMVSDIRRFTTGDSARYRVSGICIVGGASPEGSVAINNRLSHQRATTLFDYVSSAVALPDSLGETFSFLGRDWSGLKALVEADSNVPYRAETLSLLTEIVDNTAAGEVADSHNLERIKALRGGVPYAYMYGQLFPLLRESRMVVSYSPLRPALSPLAYRPAIATSTVEMIADPVIIDMIPAKCCSPFYVALKTNMLHDVLALPSIGAEFYLGKNLSIVANWTYGWWDNNKRHHYWRAYGGDIALRRWFGSKAKEKPLTGHHLGVYAGVLTYDLEWGGTGYMGGIPGGTLWDRCLVNAGVEYGYSLPVARRLNIDFTIGFGVLSGKYVKYIPVEGGYLWQSTRHINWVGPTKAEISLVWLIGCGNFNSRKGGKR